MDIEEKCFNCRFFESDIVQGQDVGACRKYAPRILSGSGTGWSSQNFPIVGGDDWCGEWESIQ